MIFPILMLLLLSPISASAQEIIISQNNQATSTPNQTLIATSSPSTPPSAEVASSTPSQSQPVVTVTETSTTTSTTTVALISTSEEGATQSLTQEAAQIEPLAAGVDRVGKEILVYDWNKGAPSKSMKRFLEGVTQSGADPIKANFNWKSPVNFANGTLYIRIHLQCLSAENPNEDFRLIFNNWQAVNGTAAESYIAPQSLPMDFQYRGNPIVKKYTFNVANMSDSHDIDPSTWVTFDWSQPRKDVGFYIPTTGSEDIKITDTSYPLDLRATVVVVAPGETFSGWSYWVGANADSETGDCTPPNVTVTSPVSDSTVSSSINISANATDNKGVTKVEFYDVFEGRNYLIGTDTTASGSQFSLTWDTSTATSSPNHGILAKAFDANGNTNSHSVSGITVNNNVVPPSPTPQILLPDMNEISKIQTDINYTSTTCNYDGPTHAGIDNANDFRAALTAATPGQTICLKAGATINGNFTFPVKTNTDKKYITIRTTALSNLPADRRICIPKSGISDWCTRDDRQYLAKIVNSTVGVEQAIDIPLDASYYRLIGLDISSQTDKAQILRIGGDGSNRDISRNPHHIIIDRSYIHGKDANQQVQIGIQINGEYVGVANSHIDEVHMNGRGDTQAIHVYNSQGYILVQNNFLEASGENFFVGGGLTGLLENLRLDQVTHDIVFRGNYVWKDPSKRLTANYDAKNLFELKWGRKVLIEGNIFENYWAGVESQYFAIMFRTSWQHCDDGTFAGRGKYAQTEHVTFRYNTVKNVANAFRVARYAECSKNSSNTHTLGYATPGTQNIHIHDNLITGLGAYPQTLASTFSLFGPDGDPDLSGTQAIGAANQIFERNTMTKPANENATFILKVQDQYHPIINSVRDFSIDLPSKVPNLTFRNNVVGYKTHIGSIKTDNGLKNFLPNSEIKNNLIVDKTNLNLLAAENKNVQGAAYESIVGSDGRLLGSYANQSSTYGANISLLEDCTGGVVKGTWNGCFVPNTGDNTDPSVSITSPTGGTVSGSITISANASDDVGVAGVQFRLDGNDLGSYDTSTPYSVSWNTTSTTNGSHTLTAIAYDTSGNSKTSTPVTVTVSNTGTPVCPSGLVSVSQTSIKISQTSTASAPQGWTGGIFKSSNTGIVSVLNSILTGVALGNSTITGTGWTAPNGATNCNLTGVTLTVSNNPIPPAICPTAGVTLESYSITKGDSTTANAPGFSGGSFVSSLPSLATVSGNTILSKESGSVNITGTGWTHQNGATNCSLSAANLSINPIPSNTTSSANRGGGGGGGGGGGAKSSSTATGSVLGAQTTNLNGMTTAQLQALLQSLIAQLNSLMTIAKARGINIPTTVISGAQIQTSSAVSYTTKTVATSLTQDLKLGDESAQVILLQKFLNSKGFTVATTGVGSPGQEGTYFGTATRDALVRYQKSKGNSGTGALGPITRSLINSEI